MGIIEDIGQEFVKYDLFGLASLLQNWLYVAVLYALLIIVAYWAVAQWINSGKYPNVIGVRKGVVDLSVMDKAKNIRGNVVERKLPSDRDIEILLRSKIVKSLDTDTLINDFRKRLENGELFSYVMRVHSWDDAFRFGEKKEIEFVTSVPIEDVWWEEHKKEFTLWNPFHGQFAKTIWAYNMTEVDENIIRPDGNLTDIYNLVLIPKHLDFDMVDPNTEIKINMNMAKIHDGNSFSRLAMWIPVFVKTLEESEMNQNEIDVLRDVVARQENEISAVIRRAESAQVQEHNEALVGKKDKRKQAEKTSLVLLGVICFIMGGVTALLPDWIPALQNTVHPIIFVLSGAVILGVVLHMMYDKKPDVPKDRGETEQ